MRCQAALLVVMILAGGRAADAAPLPERPNVVFILCDDLAQGDLGCYGQRLIRTPHLDRMAAEGTRFTQAYCGTSVCAPSRAVLLTGLDSGHCPIRANREARPEGQKPLPEGTFTVARLLRDAGYATACIGKWGLGMFDTGGSPLRSGFDRFYGYACQRHAHDYFPGHLYDDDRRVPLPGNSGPGPKRTYAQDLIAAETLRWVTDHADRPFFLFYAVTLPHGRHEIDDLGEYRDRPWTAQQRAYAAMVTRLDADVGRLLETLRALGIDDRTLVILAGDNGSSFAPDDPLARLFDQSQGGRLRGCKRTMYEGGLRQAAIARWPGVVPAGRVSDDPWAFWDVLPTCAELAGRPLPPGVVTQGRSLVDFLAGGPAPQRDHFYWELHERDGPIQAVRFGDWKAVRSGPRRALELYDLAGDSAERNDLAAARPEIVARAEALLRESRVDDPAWPWPAPDRVRTGR